MVFVGDISIVHGDYNPFITVGGTTLYGSIGKYLEVLRKSLFLLVHPVQH